MPEPSLPQAGTSAGQAAPATEVVLPARGILGRTLARISALMLALARGSGAA